MQCLFVRNATDIFQTTTSVTIEYLPVMLLIHYGLSGIA